MADRFPDPPKFESNKPMRPIAFLIRPLNFLIYCYTNSKFTHSWANFDAWQSAGFEVSNAKLAGRSRLLAKHAGKSRLLAKHAGKSRSGS
jgi:hypothetical protein